MVEVGDRRALAALENEVPSLGRLVKTKGYDWGSRPSLLSCIALSKKSQNCNFPETRQSEVLAARTVEMHGNAQSPVEATDGQQCQGVTIAFSLLLSTVWTTCGGYRCA